MLLAGEEWETIYEDLIINLLLPTVEELEWFDAYGIDSDQLEVFDA